MNSDSPPEQTSKVRPRCPRCRRPVELCLCHLLPALCPHTRVVVIQHPDERKHALNTARLLVAGLHNARLVIAEQLPPEWREQLADPGWHTRLLFPGPNVPVLDPGADSRPQCLVLLDGTWRKARKILYLNPVLQDLPHVALPPGLQSRYRVRKAPMEGALSTVEAGAGALTIIEPGVDFSPLLSPFEALIDAQIDAMGAERFKRNYRDLLRDASGIDEQSLCEARILVNPFEFARCDGLPKL